MIILVVLLFGGRCWLHVLVLIAAERLLGLPFLIDDIRYLDLLPQSVVFVAKQIIFCNI